MTHRALPVKNKKRKTYIAIALIAILYFLMFVPVNLRSSGEPNMLLLSGSDEYAQYSVVKRMTSRGATIGGTIKNLLVHNYWYYGYPFYATSAASVAPLRAVEAASGTNNTRSIMLILRQASPLWMIASILLLVSMITNFEDLLQSSSLFIFLASIPSVFKNNTWWHPDSMVTFFVIATIFCLSRDQLKLGKWFYASAITCGIATATKTVGIFFGPAILVYLFAASMTNNIKNSILFSKAIQYIAIFIFSLILSYPTLLYPSIAATVYKTLKWQSEANNFGWETIQDKGPIAHYLASLKVFWGLWPIYFISTAAGLWVLIKQKTYRALCLATLCWSIPFMAYVLFIVARKNHYYWIPILLPLYSLTWLAFKIELPRKYSILVKSLLILYLIAQFAINLNHDTSVYNVLLKEESAAPAARFYKKLTETKVIGNSRASESMVFRDVYVFLPESEFPNQTMKWGTADYELISQINPGYIILQTESIKKYSDQSVVDKSFDKDQANKSYLFYRDALDRAIKGYDSIMEDEFAVVFQRKKVDK